MENEIEKFIIATAKDANDKGIHISPTDLPRLAKVRFGLTRQESTEIVQQLFKTGTLVSHPSNGVLVS